jgi:hypothetical protein
VDEWRGLDVHIIVPNIIVPLDVVLALARLVLVNQLLHHVPSKPSSLRIVELVQAVCEHLLLLVVVQEGAFCLHLVELLEDALEKLIVRPRSTEAMLVWLASISPLTLWEDST